MVERISELQGVKTTVAVINKGIPVFTEKEWLACKDLTSILKTFEEVTVQISGEEYVTGREVIVLVNRLTKVCEKMKHEQYILKVVNDVKELQKSFVARMKNIEHLLLCLIQAKVFPGISTILSTEVSSKISDAAAKSAWKFSVWEERQACCRFNKSYRN
ncbi:hypothetical protein PR048_006181 [Dryococelus australis]|uniref:Uncharacterized protein n=1 Tax=Dryococelus australis TaxID=614101 RepID=A0ABQ9IAB7_9NEOP|nr:hypothetical protein PR048_006181 [Dryococelus australis]